MMPWGHSARSRGPLPSLVYLSGAAALVLVGAGCERASFAPSADAAQADAQTDPPVDIPDANSPPALDSVQEAPASCSAPSLPGCAPAGWGVCDPVCQTGGCDWCTQKCSFAYGSDGGVVPTCTRRGTAVFPQACSSTAAGSVRQSDDCAPGSVCLPPIIGDSPTYCFALCRSRADCTYAVECAPRTLSAAGEAVSVCDPPYDQCGRDGTCCDPLANQGCGENRVCLLVSPDLGSGHSRTVCELSFGDGRNGSSCASARDCQLRNACVAGACREVCSDAAPCPAGLVCVPHGSELGYCS